MGWDGVQQVQPEHCCQPLDVLISIELVCIDDHCLTSLADE